MTETAPPPYPVVHDPDYVAPLGPGHRFPMSKYHGVMAALDQLGAADWAQFHAPELSSREELCAAHAPGYVDAVLALQVDPAMERRIGFPVTAQVVRRSRLACAGSLLAARLAMAHGAASNTAGGSHHAAYDSGAGFCVFNDVAVAAHQLLAEAAVQQILVVDLDVHQGDGTAALFRDDMRVFTFSMHCGANFPVRKQPGDLDIALDIGTGDGPYLDALARHLPGLLDRLHPDLLFFNAGVDPHADDKLGRLALSDDGLQARDQMVAQACQTRDIPLVTVMGGGYGDDVMAVARRHARTIHTVAQTRAGKPSGG